MQGEAKHEIVGKEVLDTLAKGIEHNAKAIEVLADEVINCFVKLDLTKNKEELPIKRSKLLASQVHENIKKLQERISVEIAKEEISEIKKSQSC